MSSEKKEETLYLPTIPYKHNTIFIAGGGVIGTTIAQEYLNLNWKVCVVTKQSTPKLQGNEKNILLIKSDLTNFSSTQSAVSRCVQTFGPFSVAVCCAGELPKIGALSNEKLGSPTPICGIELNFARAVSSILRQEKEGSIYFMNTSLYSVTVDTPGLTEILAWGNALTGLAEGLNTELRQVGIRVGLITLGFVRGSPFSRRIRDIFSPKPLNPAIATDESKWVDPKEVAKTLQFITNPTQLGGSMWEIELTPQIMFDKNQIFTDDKRVLERVKEITVPFMDGKVAIVTGAGKGIGRGIALELCKAGYHVAGFTRTMSDLQSLGEECSNLNPKCKFLPIAIDVTNEKALEDAVNKVVETFGTISLVVSNAGTNRRRVAALADMKTWRDVLEVDLLSAMNISRLTIPYLIRHAQFTKQSQKPLLSFVSTRYAHQHGVRMPGISPYVASKSATNAFARVVREEVRDFGVAVVDFNPGSVATELGLRPNKASKNGRLIPPEYLIQPIDCGKSILFAAQELGNATCATTMWLESVHHPYPAVRTTQSKYLSKL